MSAVRNAVVVDRNSDDRMELKRIVQHLILRGCDPGLMETTRVYLLARQIKEAK